jgi:hypothetical protein
MKLFIWKRAIDVTRKWHTEGAICVVAENLEEARQAFLPYVEAACTARMSEPDIVMDLLKPEPLVEIFPDAGCC